MPVERPAGVTAVAAAYFLSGAYLLVVGLIMLVRPGVVSMEAGAPLLGGLELAGPYMFLLAGGVCVIVALGLWWLHRWARWLAILIAIISVIMLLPSVSSAMLDFRIVRLAWGGLGTILRVLIVWYLFQEPAHNSFNAK
jgi:multidrug transporter EmrE-like cation transporter